MGGVGNKAKKHHARAPLWQKVMERCSKSGFLELAGGATGAAEVVAAIAARTSPSTRAGGQDDVS